MPKKAEYAYFPDSLRSLIDQDINSGEFLCGLPAHAGDKECRHLFLNIYDEAKIRKRFEQIGLISYLHDKGYTKIKISEEHL